MIDSQYSEKIIGFVQYLRDNGHNIGIKELADTMGFIGSFNHPDENLTQHCLRSLCCHNKEQWQQFDHLFNCFWYPDTVIEESSESTKTTDTLTTNNQDGPISGIAGTTTSHFETISNSGLTGAGKQNTITKADFRFLNNKQAMREAENLAEKLALQLKARTRLQRKIRLTGNRIDMRHTIRRSMSYGGIPLHPVFTIKYRKPPHLVILHDVSHSMNWNNPLLFRFARGLVKACPESDAFVFHTRLFCVTELYREKSIPQMRKKLESNNHLWLGGTCIAESLDYFNQNYARNVLRSDSVVIIISDGLDTDSPEYLANQLALIRNKTKQMIWLNPMMVRQASLSDSATMHAAKPFVDHFAPAHSVEALREVVYTLKI